MQDAKIKFDGREFLIDRDITTIGRTPDNDVSFSGDSNVSRYHAEIERRGGDHWLIDLNSSNGTAVNGDAVSGERRLESGDKILFGGSSEAEFVIGETTVGMTGSDSESDLEFGGPGLSEAAGEIGSVESYIGSAAQLSGGGFSAPAVVDSPVASSNPTVLIAGVVAGLAVVFLVAAVLFYSTRSSSCTARAVIIKPEPGDTITEPTEIVVNAENTECVSRAVFTIEGREVATAEPPSFTATLDPATVPEFADGVDHALEITLIDNAGERIPQSNPVLVAFETRAVTKPEPTPSATQANNQPTRAPGGKQPSLVQINEMSQRLVKQLAGSFSYNVTNKQFLQEVQKKTTEYAQEGYFQRASPFRDVINVAFVREQNIAAPFGFFLAMSRSKFNPARQGEFEGLWQMSSAFVAENKYNGSCGTETLSDASQNCAAKSAALYMKSMIFGVFDGDLIYSAAAFGKSPKDASDWKATLPANRVDVWNSIRTQAEREQLIRFFAAAIVAENPQAFGLTKDRPLSELYRVTM